MVKHNIFSTMFEISSNITISFLYNNVLNYIDQIRNVEKSNLILYEMQMNKILSFSKSSRNV